MQIDYFYFLKKKIKKEKNVKKDYPMQGLLNFLTSYYRFQNNANDIHGSGHLTSAGAINFTQGLIGNGYLCQGAILRNLDPLTTVGSDESYTWSLWIKPSNLSNDFGIIARSNLTTNREWEMGYNVTQNRFRFRAFHASGSVFVDSDKAGDLAPNQWYRIVFGYHKTKNIIGIQVNNHGVDFTSASGTLLSNVPVPTTIGGANNANFRAPSGTVIDEVGFWRGEALNRIKRSFLYNDGSGISYGSFSYVDDHVATECLIKAEDFVASGTLNDQLGAYKRGDLVAVFPSGHVWGRLESKQVWVAEGNAAEDWPNKFRIVVIEGLSLEKAKRYVQPQTSGGVISGGSIRDIVRRRKFRFNVDNFPSGFLETLEQDGRAVIELPNLITRVQNKVNAQSENTEFIISASGFNVLNG